MTTSIPIVLEVGAELIDANRAAFKARVLDVVAVGAKLLVIDATDSWIDSSGLGVLVSVQRKLREVGGRLIIAGASQEMRDLFAYTHLDDVFTLCDTVEQAEEALRHA